MASEIKNTTCWDDTPPKMNDWDPQQLVVWVDVFPWNSMIVLAVFLKKTHPSFLSQWFFDGF